MFILLSIFAFSFLFAVVKIAISPISKSSIIEPCHFSYELNQKF